MLGDLFNNGSPEQRAVSFQSIWGAGDSLAWQSDSGANVTPDSSFGVSAFYAAVNLISGSISTLPVDCFYKQNGERKPFRPKPEWVSKPDVDLISSQAHWQQVLISLLVWGNSYTRVFRDKAGNIVNLVALDPTLVNVQRNAIGRKIYTYTGEEKALTSDDVLHITDMLLPGAVKGKGRVEALKENIGLGIALQAFAAFRLSECHRLVPNQGHQSGNQDGRRCRNGRGSMPFPFLATDGEPGQPSGYTESLSESA